MPEISTNPFLAALSRSGVLDCEQFGTIAAVVDPSADPKTIASQLVRDQVLTPWQARFLLSGRDNLIVGKYILLERLSQDGLGDKFLAIHQQLGRRVDLQILPAELSGQAESLRRFLSETTAAAKLDSPSLVHVYDVDQHQGRYYVVSEHFEARSLQQILEAGSAWELVSIAAVGRQWIVGLAFALGHGVLHRDVTPRSLLVADDGSAKVGDITLGSLARRLANAAADVLVESTAEDDVAQLGRHLIQFVDTCGGTGDAHARQRLRSVIDQLTRVRAWEVELPRIQGNLDQWLSRQQRALTERQETPTGAGDTPHKRALFSTGKPGAAGKTGGESMFVVDQRHWYWIGGASAAVCLLLAAVIWSSARAKPGTGPGPGSAQFTERGGTRSKESNPARTAKKARPTPSPQAEVSPLDNAVEKHNAAQNQVDRRDGTSPPGQSTDPIASVPPDVVKPNVELPAATLPNAPAATAQTTADNLAGPPNTPSTATPAPPAEQMMTIAEAQKLEQGKSSPPDAAARPDSAIGIEGDLAVPMIQAPWIHLPETFELPADMAVADATLIGAVNTGPNDLLGVTLLTDKELTRKIDFALVRAAGDQSQRWTVTANSKAIREPLEIASFFVEDGQLKFHWLDAASTNANFGYLRNCLLKLELRNDFRYLPLRTPIQLPALLISADEPGIKREFDLPFAPERELLTVVVQEIGNETPTSAEKFLLVFEPSEQTIPERGACSVFLTQKADRFLRLDLEAKLAKKSVVSAQFVIAANSLWQEDRAYSPKAFAELSEAFAQHAQTISAELEARNQYLEAKRDTKELEGKITEFRETIAKTKDSLEAANLLINELAAQHAATEHLFGQPIKIRIVFTLGEQQVELARLDGISAVPAALENSVVESVR